MINDPNQPLDNPNPSPNRLPPNFHVPEILKPGLMKETALAIHFENHKGLVHLIFNKPVSLLMLSPEQARGLAIQMLLNAEAAPQEAKISPTEDGS